MAEGGAVAELNDEPMIGCPRQRSIGPCCRRTWRWLKLSALGHPQGSRLAFIEASSHPIRNSLQLERATAFPQLPLCSSL